MSKPAVLIIEDSASLALGYAAQLEEAGYEVTLAATLAEAEDALATTRFAATLLDLQLPDGDGLSLLEKRNATSPAFVVITADGSLSRAIAAMRLGAVYSGRSAPLLSQVALKPSKSKLVLEVDGDCEDMISGTVRKRFEQLATFMDLDAEIRTV